MEKEIDVSKLKNPQEEVEKSEITNTQEKDKESIKETTDEENSSVQETLKTQYTRLSGPKKTGQTINLEEVNKKEKLKPLFGTEQPVQ